MNTMTGAPLHVWKSQHSSVWFVDCNMCGEAGQQVWVGDSQEEGFDWAEDHWREHNPYGERGEPDRRNVVEFPINYEL